MTKPSWRIRRRIVIATLLFCAFCVLWVLVTPDERSVLEVIVMCAFGLAASTIGAYVFGSVYDDKNVMRTMGAKAYQEEPMPYIDEPQR